MTKQGAAKMRQLAFNLQSDGYRGAASAISDTLDAVEEAYFFIAATDKLEEFEEYKRYLRLPT